MERGGLAVAFESWALWVAASKQMWLSASRVAARLQSTATFAAFAAWAEYHVQCRLVRRVTARMTSKRLSSAFACWASNVYSVVTARTASQTESSLAQLRAEMESQAEQHRTDIMRKALVKVQYSTCLLYTSDAADE